MPRLKATLAVVYKQVLILNHESSTHKPLCHMLAPIRIRASRWPSSLCHKQGNDIKSISVEEQQGTLGDFKTPYCP